MGMADIEYLVPRRSSKFFRKSYFYAYYLNDGLIIIGDLPLLTSDFMGNLDTIGGDMWRTIHINKTNTFFMINDNSNMIVVDVKE